MPVPSPMVDTRADPLSARERVVVDHVLAGRSNKWIALDLALSEPTVSRLLRRALDKLGAVSVAALARGPIAPLQGLNRSEVEIVRVLLEGRSNAAIAARRGTSPRTVAHQLTGIYAKLGVASRRELMTRLGCPGQPAATCAWSDHESTTAP